MGRIFIISNAIDDDTRSKRRIVTDSPAASKKVFDLAYVLKKANFRVYILSVGRGRGPSNKKIHPACVKRVRGVPTLYCSFTTNFFTSKITSLVSIMYLLIAVKLNKFDKVIFYNRMYMYIFALLFSKISGASCYLDLEDGEKFNESKLGLAKRIYAKIFDSICRDGALLACRALRSHTSIQKHIEYYGALNQVSDPRNLHKQKLRVLYSGTLLEDTGALIVLEAIKKLRDNQSMYLGLVSFDICGQGDHLNQFKALSNSNIKPIVRFHGRLSTADYRSLLEDCDIGLSLKLSKSYFADTTFPSKVIEYASSGLLVVSTDISDVREVLGEGAFYLKCETADELIGMIKTILDDIDIATSIQKCGQENVVNEVNESQVIHKFQRFFSNESTS